MYPQPARVLGTGSGSGSGSGSEQSDNPYQNQPEINSLDDTPAPSETTSLLSSKARRVRPKRSAGGAATPPVRTFSSDSVNAREEDVVLVNNRGSIRRPWRLKLSFFFACLLLYVNFSFLILTIASVRSPFMAHNSLPTHRGSMFFPIWLCLLSLVINILTLLAFSAPLESPHLASTTSLLSALFLVIDLILILAVGQLRHREGILTLVLIGISILSLLHAAASALLVESYAPLLDPPPPRSQIEEPGLMSSLSRALKALLTFLGVSLPIALLHLAIVAGFGMLTFGVIVRAYDASLLPDGQIWKVNPWRKRHNGGLTELNGRSFNLHLACRGVEVDPIFMAVAGGGNLSSSALVVPQQEAGVEQRTAVPVRRTILVETEQGVPGKVGAEWVTKMLREGVLTSPDTEVRVCFYDRPGYGFSDNSPSAAIPHVVTALTEALHLSGEIARLEPLPRPNSNSDLAPSPTAIPGFILVPTRYGALSATLFSALHPHLVHSILYLSPIPPALHFSSRASHNLLHPFKFFFTSVLSAFSSELGVYQTWSVLRRKSREYRVYSTERSEIRGEIMRSYVQEEGEKHNPGSHSARGWENARTRYPERPSIVFTESESKKAWRKEGYSQLEWIEGQKRFVEETVKEGLVKWVDDWEGDCVKDEERCRKALIKLVKMD